MAGIWVRAGTATLTNGSKKVTGSGTAWNTGTNKVGKGCAFIYNNIEYEVDYVNSDTELYLVDTYSGTTGSGLSYRIQVAVTDTIPELSARIASALAYWNSQGANLQALTTGSGNVTLTAPDGTQVVVPAYSGMQPKDAILTALAALTTAADKLVYFTGADTVDQTTLTAFARTVLAGKDASAMLSILGAASLSRTGTGGGFSFRNKIVDGRFDFWYEATTQSTSGYGSSTMWMNSHNGSTKVASQQPLVAGVDLPANDCPSAQYFLRNIVTSTAGASNYVDIVHKIENVNTLAGKTATLSFYAKADSAKNITVWAFQNFGSGGSAPVDGISSQSVGLTTSWKRYSVQITLPSISGKTIGTSSYMSIGFGFDLGSGLTQLTNSCGQQSGTFDIACVQLEEGSVATPFEELPIDISQQRVNRYFQQIALSADLPISFSTSVVAEIGIIPRPVVMRATPSHTYSSATGMAVKSVGGYVKVTSSSIGSPHCSAYYFDLAAYASSYTWAAGDFVNVNLTLNADARL